MSMKGRLRRQKILSVANNILLSDGIDKLVLRQVAKQADIKLGHLQHYFSTRDDLLEAIIFEAWNGDELILSRATSVKDVKRVVNELLLSWRGDKGKIYLVLAIRSLYDERFKRLKVKIYQTFYDDLIAFMKIIHPSRSKQELLRQTKIVTSLLDGAIMQVNDGTEQSIEIEESELHKDLIEVASNLILA